MIAMKHLFFLLAVLLPLAATGQEEGTCGDGQLIFELPARAEAARKTAKEGWDSGVTADMVEATVQYNEALKSMILDLNKTYYVEPAGAEEIGAYVSALGTVDQFERAASNPRNQASGTIVSVEAGAQISDALEKTISQMVFALIGEDKHYSFADWKKQWQAAIKPGE